jgi:hypothetical protein
MPEPVSPNPQDQPKPKEENASPLENTNPLNAFFGELIFAYTRADALEDGILIDVSTLAREAGFLLPTAVTAALWGDLENIPPDYGQDVQGRLWDVLYMGNIAINLAVKEGRGNSPVIVYGMLMPFPKDDVGVETLYYVKSVIGPGDDGKPVMTFMKPDED